MHTDNLLLFFAYTHLPPELAEISKPFGDLAVQIVATLPANAERTVALRKLLEAKDCAVRAHLFPRLLAASTMKNETAGA